MERSFSPIKGAIRVILSLLDVSFALHIHQNKPATCRSQWLLMQQAVKLDFSDYLTVSYIHFQPIY